MASAGLPNARGSNIGGDLGVMLEVRCAQCLSLLFTVLKNYKNRKTTQQAQEKVL